MGHGVGLRKVLASKRGLAAALVSAGVLAVGVSPAQAGRPAWSKAWAEQLLRKSFAAVSAVCLPLGPAVRQKGENAFREFVCVVVTADGSRYTVHLKPRSHTAWTTIGITNRDGPAPERGKPAKPHPPHGR